MFPKDKLFNILRKKYGVLIVTAPGNNKNNNKSRNRKKFGKFIHTRASVLSSSAKTPTWSAKALNTISDNIVTRAPSLVC